MSHTFTGLSVPSATTARKLHVGIGDGEPFNDAAMLFNGTAITPANFWSGTEGNYWDDEQRAFSAGRSLPAGTTTRTNSQPLGPRVPHLGVRRAALPELTGGRRKAARRAESTYSGMSQSGNQRAMSSSQGSSAPSWAWRRSSRSVSRACSPGAGTNG